MISLALTKDINSIRRLGIDALTEKLGPIGMVEFMRQFDSGYGDYTKERDTWLDNLTIEEISNEIKKRDTQG
jgi:DNA-directed RNA polymerase